MWRLYYHFGRHAIIITIAGGWVCTHRVPGAKE
ncbi:hypothetical protein Goshw_025859 [Gossypium schwendimanii]|uniref:Uncharacterized protein n=1 Tax=Gossypium schwendimanii TaxID=34291 RepID=A0A7J9MYQ0_GOSSC|nr:hypothetical protein [Gossypium schwendimanii]